MARGIFRKQWRIPISRRAIYRDEGTTSEGEGPTPSTIPLRVRRELTGGMNPIRGGMQ